MRGIDVDVAPRRGVRLPRAQRRGQVVHDADDRLRVAALRRHAPGARHGSGHRRPADPRPHRRRAAAGQPRHRAHRPGEPGGLRAVLRALPGARAREGRRAAGVRPAHRPGRRAGRAALGRHEAAADDRPLPGQRPRAAAARRADHRARPAGPPPAVGAALPAQARGRHPDHHHALHGRGRAAVRPAGRDGRRGDRRRGFAGRADRALLHARGAGAAVRARHRPGGGRAGAARRPGRGAARPAAALHRRRRARAGRGAPRGPPAAVARWCGARRWRTCSCGSPAGAWSNDRSNGCHRPAGPARGGVLLVIEHFWTWYRRNWRATAVSSILQPLLFLLAFGVGFGTLVDGAAGRRQPPPAAWPTSCGSRPPCWRCRRCRAAVFDSTYPVLSGFKWQRHLPRDDGHADHARSRSRSGTSPGWRSSCGSRRDLRRGHRGVRRRVGPGDRRRCWPRRAHRARPSRRWSPPTRRPSRTRAGRSPCCSGWW